MGHSTESTESRAKYVILIFAIAVAFCHLCCSPVCGQDSGLPRKSLDPGLDWILWNGETFCKAGDPKIAVLVVNPAKFRFHVFHYSAEKLPEPPTLLEWMERKPALAMFNGGQYYPDYSYMGLLVAGGSVVFPKIHHLFQGLFVAEPKGGKAPLARIIDLSVDAFDPNSLEYRQIAQSFMLFDRSGSIRVRKTIKVANRTVVAEGMEGKIWIFVTHGGYTLWEFGHMLRSGPFPLRQAMAMDGGFEAQMIVSHQGFHYDSLGTWIDETLRTRPGPRTRRPLPAVLGVFPRE
jgi:hypothetical protein